MSISNTQNFTVFKKKLNGNFKNFILILTVIIPSIIFPGNYNFGFPTPGPQTPGAQKVMDHVFFLSETEWKQVREEESFDYVVVGSGICSYAFVKTILDENPHAKILVIERGPFFLPEHFQNLPVPYFQTLGGLSEVFPWTLSMSTMSQPKGSFQWQHGMVPFFGGRSIMWSSWCPRPTVEEMNEWPNAIIQKAQDNFASAEALLNVIPTDQISLEKGEDWLYNTYCTEHNNFPVYGRMQKAMQEMLKKNLHKVSSSTRSMAAPLACGAGLAQGIDFAKFSVPGPMLELIDRQIGLAKDGAGEPLKIVCNCLVNRIIQQNGKALALDTSRGVVSLGNAKLILAMGTVPPATLLMNSFPENTAIGNRFTAHFISAIVARIPKADYEFCNQLADLEFGAIYMAGTGGTDNQQYHVQLSIIADQNPEKNVGLAGRYAPDVVATASKEQLANSEDHLIFVCAVLGGMDHKNKNNFLRLNGGSDPSNNITLQAIANENDHQTWDAMDQGAFEMLELALSPNGSKNVDYWHPKNEDLLNSEGSWEKSRPTKTAIRVPGLVHEGSTLWIGEETDGAPVGFDYRPYGVDNVYITGGGLWPTSGSWNPTMTMVALTIDLAKRLQKGL